MGNSPFPSKKGWVEAEFNPASLELARMSKLLEEADRYMIQVKCGQERFMRVSYAILTQVLDYFYFILEDGKKAKFDELKRLINEKITLVERKTLNSKKRGREMPVGSIDEAEAIDLLVKFQNLIYHYKGIMGLGIVFKKRMSSEDILDNALGIAKIDKETAENNEEDEVNEEELGDLEEGEEENDNEEIQDSEDV